MSNFFRPDASELTEDARHLLAELDRESPGTSNLNGDCRPPLDVFDTTEAVEVVVDIPGVAADSLRVAVRRGTVLIVGTKVPAPSSAGARFHLAERAYGRFARAVRLSGPVDASRARALMTAGQLRITLPRIEDRRGRTISVAVSQG